MNLRSVGLALAAALGTALVVGVLVTELLAARIAFSLFVGIPAGLLAGAVAGAVVAWGLLEGAPAARRRLALSFGAFGGTLLAVLVVGVLLPFGTLVSTLAGTVLGVAVAVAVYALGGPRIGGGRDVSRAD